MSEYRDLGWDEQAYLDTDPRIRAAVEQGLVRDGYHHHMLLGRFRGGGRDAATGGPSPTTRMCLDPWLGAEFSVDGKLKPCCNIYRGVDLQGATPENLRGTHNADFFRTLRHQLLTGELGAECARCHIREKVSTGDLMAELYPKLGDGAHLLEGGPLEFVRVDVTGRCNLRCVYCAMSVEGASQGEHMPDDKMDQIAAFIAAHDGLQDVGVNGHGETTHHPRWKPFCDRLLAAGAPLSVITNLGRRYDDDEIDTLSRFTVIQVSIDTADEDLLRRLRRKVELSRILTNMTRIRLHALLSARKPPVFAFSCGVYDKTVFRLEELAGLAVTMGVRNITFWDLVQYPDLPGAEKVRPLRDLDDDDLRRALGHFDRAMAILGMYRINVSVAGGFIEPLRRKLAEHAGVG